MRKWVERQPTLTPPNEPLTCDGCDMQGKKSPRVQVVSVTQECVTTIPVVRPRDRREKREQISEGLLGKKCPHFHTIDMSIDDLLCACDILQAECDACDEDFCFLICPLSERPPEGDENT